ncbi:TPA: hypothetical protein ACN34C_004717 [Vibrio parahaemolyticus]
MKTKELVPIVLEYLRNSDDVAGIKKQYSITEENWNRISEKVYSLNLELSRKKRLEDQVKQNVSCTDLATIELMLESTTFLASKALCLPTTVTLHQYELINSFRRRKYFDESILILFIEQLVMNPKMRAHQKLGRFQHFDAFKSFSSYIDSALVCYYRKNYHSCFLTLAPIIEGIILKWLGYQHGESKPKFDELKKFFRNGYRRNPCPGNPLFYHIYAKACDEILSNHFYLNSEHGVAYGSFNRHLASHMLTEEQFSSRENCIRLFVLLDTMTELYLYETGCSDPRFYLKHEEVIGDYTIYSQLISEGSSKESLESMLL